MSRKLMIFQRCFLVPHHRTAWASWAWDRCLSHSPVLKPFLNGTVQAKNTSASGINRQISSYSGINIAATQKQTVPEPRKAHTHHRYLLPYSASDRTYSPFQNLLFRLSSSTSGTAADREKSCDYLDATDSAIYDILAEHMTVVKDFLSEDEEKSLLDEVDSYMKRLRYEYDHWDNAIHGYRETEKRSWNDANSQILQRVKDIAFDGGVSPLAYVHVLDIAKEGYIKPHVDAVRFCGDTIAGMCLLSSCVMRLALEKDKTKFGDIHLPQRCLYIMRGKARYDFTHEVLKEEESIFKGQTIPRDRRMSVICRNEPDPADQE
ncbi:alpha-ketoglutarate-dependent dioxygenase alkB homolog 7, mitochondrial [Aplysia californica]|uniref:Alpha-ketoglutarate-dependent dioxygenase alkB homolog 7, mitochondrial n=1 Tax=Aplysia californica TaxID=6500 RepID=A0ABM0K2V2_APLCA|nr:alpha-ketoglutarate-dependent dioxygenase alkB homolog 7, mitochondrial [Aplysia californica]